MSKFKRRPFMAGHTDVFVMSQPYITGTEHINSDGLLDSVEALTSGVTQFELSFETEDGTADFQLDVAVAPEADRTLAAIVGALNTAFGASSVSSLIEASDFEGCLRLQSLGSGLVDTNGDGAADTLSYIKIVPNRSGSSFVDGAALFGLPAFPHPSALVTAGDLAHSPVRPLTQVNRPGVAFIARGEDRVSQNFNRALHQLAINEDSLNTRLKARVPVPTVLDISRTSTRLLKDASGHITAVALYGTHSDSLDAVLGSESRVFVGGLSGSSSLLDISNFFSVQDQEDNQIQADQRVVRVGAVTSGYTGSVTVPTFVSEGGAPTSAVPDSSSPLDNGNLLGLQYEKSAATVISSIKDGCVLVCDSATFSTDGVIKGDLITIAGSTITAPISHNGTYCVETVISETELEVRPLDHDNVLILNESESGGLGSATVTTDGKFAQNVVLMFSPPISDFPPDRVAEDGTTPISAVLRIVLGVEAPLGEVPSEFLVRSTVKTAAEVDAFVTRRVWRRMSFDGLYQGQSYDFRGSQQGGGAEGRITHGPISLSISSNRDRPASLTTEMAGTGSLEMRGNDLVLSADITYVFSDTDIGKVVFVSDTGGTLFADETPFVLSEFLSYREIRLTPPVDYKDWRAADLAGTTSCSFTVVGEGQAALQAAMLFVANDKTAEGSDAAKTGLVFVRNHRDGADGAVSPGTSHLHLERVRNVKTWDTATLSDADAHFLSAATTASARTVTLSGATASDVVHLKYNTHLFWGENATIRSSNGIGCTLLRIVNGPNAGFYEIHELASDTGEFTVQPCENAFDGATTWAGFISTSVTQVANLYNVVFSVGGKRTAQDPVLGAVEVTSGVTAFADAADKVAEGSYTPASGVARAIQAHWIGEGSALHVRVNDPDFYAISSEAASTGYAIDVRTYNPAAGGHIRAHGSVTNSDSTSRFAQALKVFTDSNVLSAYRDSGADPFALAASTWGSGLTSVSQWADPAAFFGIGYAENAEEGVSNVGDSEQNSSSALVIRDVRGLTTSQQEVPVGLFQGAMAYTGSVFGSTNSPLISMSSIASSTAVLPVYGGSQTISLGETLYGSVNQEVVLDQKWTLSVDSLARVVSEGKQGYFDALPSVYAETEGFGFSRHELGAPTWKIGDYDPTFSGVRYNSQNVVWSVADYSTFAMKHNFCVEISIPDSLLVYVHSLPGRLAWMGFDTAGGTTQDVSYLYRVEGVAQTGAGTYKVALRADTDSEVARNSATATPSSGATLTSLGFKAARWTRAYIDLADNMILGTGIGSGHDGMLPVLGTTRGLDRALVSGTTASTVGYENTYETPSWSTRFPSTYEDLVLRQGSIGQRRLSLNVEGSAYSGAFSEIGDSVNFSTNFSDLRSLRFSGHSLVGSASKLWEDPTGLAQFPTGQAAAPFSNEFIFGGLNARNSAYSSWYRPHTDMYLSESDTADARSMRHRDLHISVESLPSSYATTLTGAGMNTDPVVFRARWSPSREGALAITVGDSTDSTNNSVGLVRIWIPVGRNIQREHFNLQLETVISTLSGDDLGSLGSRDGEYLQVDLRDPEGASLCTRGLRLYGGHTSPGVPIPLSGTLVESIWEEVVQFQSDPSESPTSLEDGATSGTAEDMNGRTYEREIPLFITVDVLLGSRAAAAAAAAAAVDPKLSFTDTVENVSRQAPIFFETLYTALGNNYHYPGINFHVLQASPGESRDAHLSSGLEVGGVLSAKSIRLREPRRSLKTYSPAEARFITGSVYANVYSNSAVASVNSSARFSFEDTAHFGSTTSNGMGSVVGMFQPWSLPDDGSAFPECTITYGGLTYSLDKRDLYNSSLVGTVTDNSPVYPPVGDRITGVNTYYSGTPYEAHLPDGGSHDSDDDGASISRDPWLSPEIPQQSMVLGPNGAQIIGGNWSDPLWYQQAILLRNITGTHSRFMQPLSGNITSILASEKPRFLVDTARLVSPAPTGFMVPLTDLRRGDLLQEISFHVSVSPHVWAQTKVLSDFPTGGGSVGTSISGLASKQWWLNDYRQASWGVYYEIPYCSDGLLADLDDPDTGSLKDPLISHHPEAWQPRGGFVVELWESPLGIVPEYLDSDSSDAGIISDGKEAGRARVISSKVVKFTEVFGDDNTGSSLEDYFPASRSAITTTDRVSRYEYDSSADHSKLLDQSISVLDKEGELHIRGSLLAGSGPSASEDREPPPNSSHRVDPTQFAYYVVIKFFLTGPRMLSSSGSLMNGDSIVQGNDVDAYLCSEMAVDRGIGLNSEDYAGFVNGRGLRTVPPPHGHPTDTPAGVAISEPTRTLPSVTLKGIRTSVLTDKP